MALPWEIIYDYVQDEVNRREKEAEIKRRIQRAVLKYHKIEEFRRDLVEGPRIFNTSEFIQQIDITTVPTFRKVKYIRLMDPNQINSVTGILGTDEANDFEEVSVDRLMDGYGADRTRVWYLGGTSVNLRAGMNFSAVQWGYLATPIVDPIENINSWIAAEHPELIAQDVAKRIFISVGKLDEASGMEKERARSELLLLSSDVISK